MTFFLTLLQNKDILPLIISLSVGMLIGIERELSGKPAGMRTCALVCLGSCILCLLTQHLDPVYADRGHIASNIVQGIGFLCAGTILIHKDKIIGLTTAAVVWLTSSLGMTIGFRQYALTFFGTLLCLITLIIFRFIESIVVQHRNKKERKVI